MLHLTARVASLPLHHEDTGSWLWRYLRAAFPQALAVVLMPDHLHMILSSVEASLVEQRLARLLGHFGRSFDVRSALARVAPAEAIRSQAALARHIRYVALNPCRAALASCPLEWPWSTHRDLIGACVDPWVTADRLAAALGVSRRDFEARHHAYVSGDPHASVTGTPFPRAVPSVDIPAVPLQTLIDATAAATRTAAEDVPRALLVALAIDQGWRHTALLAGIAGCSPRTVQRLAKQVDARALACARMCAGDARLRVAPASAASKADVEPAFRRRAFR
jgi:hypothetical protein